MYKWKTYFSHDCWKEQLLEQNNVTEIINDFVYYSIMHYRQKYFQINLFWWTVNAKEDIWESQTTHIWRDIENQPYTIKMCKYILPKTFFISWQYLLVSVHIVCFCYFSPARTCLLFDLSLRWTYLLITKESLRTSIWQAINFLIRNQCAGKKLVGS